MIRRLAPTDAAKLRPLLAEIHQRSAYARLTPHWPTIFQTIIKASASTKGVVFVAEHDTELTGILVGVAQEYWWAEPGVGPMVASDLLFFSKRTGDGREMMRKFVAWARSKPRVARIEVGVSFGKSSGRTTVFYESMGFRYSGPMFVIDVERKEP